MSDTTEAVISRARLAHPALDELATAVEHICELRAEWDRRISCGDLDKGAYLKVATEMVLWRSRCEQALRNVGL